MAKLNPDGLNNSYIFFFFLSVSGDRWLELEFSSDENENEDDVCVDNNNGCSEELEENSDAEPMSNEALFFNKKHGSLIKLSKQRRTAERMHAMDEFNNGVVMTNRPLRNNEMFEVRGDGWKKFIPGPRNQKCIYRGVSQKKCPPQKK